MKIGNSQMLKQCLYEIYPVESTQSTDGSGHTLYASDERRNRLFSLYGGPSSCEYFGTMIQTAKGRDTLVETIRRQLQKSGFKGLDLQCDPVQARVTQQTYAEFMEQLRSFLGNTYVVMVTMNSCQLEPKLVETLNRVADFVTINHVGQSSMLSSALMYGLARHRLLLTTPSPASISCPLNSDYSLNEVLSQIEQHHLFGAVVELDRDDVNNQCGEGPFPLFRKVLDRLCSNAECNFSGFVRDTRNCGQYYSCDNGITTSHHCPVGHSFDLCKSTCEPFLKVDCNSTTCSVSGGLPNGFFPVPYPVPFPFPNLNCSIFDNGGGNNNGGNNNGGSNNQSSDCCCDVLKNITMILTGTDQFSELVQLLIDLGLDDTFGELRKALKDILPLVKNIIDQLNLLLGALLNGQQAMNGTMTDMNGAGVQAGIIQGLLDKILEIVQNLLNLLGVDLLGTGGTGLLSGLLSGGVGGGGGGGGGLLGLLVDRATCPVVCTVPSVVTPPIIPITVPPVTGQAPQPTACCPCNCQSQQSDGTTTLLLQLISQILLQNIGGQTSPIGVTLPPLTGTLLGQLQQNTGVVPQLLEVVSQAVQSLLGGGGGATLLQGLPGISTLLGQTNGGVLPGLLQVVSQAAQGLLVTLPPVTLPPVTLPPVTLPPITLPPVTVPTLPAVTLPGVTLPGLGGSLVSVSLQANLELLNGLLPALLTLLPLLLPLLPALLGALPLLGLPANLVNIVGDLQANLGVLGGVLPTVLSLVQTLLPVLGALPAGLPSLPVTLPSLLPQVANVMVDLQASLGGLDSVLQTVLGITSRRPGDATTNNDSHTPRYATTYHGANCDAATYHGANCDAATYHGANCDAATYHGANCDAATGNASTGDSNTVGSHMETESKTRINALIMERLKDKDGAEAVEKIRPESNGMEDQARKNVQKE
uniref:Chitin-binding type-2 domain-containing protein n=1 Tax=Anopheles merus TaxID=30066 RepID=A0A182V6A7_ANOME